MTSSLKTTFVIAAVMSVAFGAAGTTSAAASEEFICSFAPCQVTVKQEGTGATGHQVFIVENSLKTESVSFTCHGVSGSATLSSTTSTQATLEKIAYSECTVNGSPGVAVDMNGCHYRFNSVRSIFSGTAAVHIECFVGKGIQITIPALGCTFEIPPQTVEGATYQTVGTSPNREVRVSNKISGVSVTASAGCSSLINPSQTLTGTYTTGEVLATAELDVFGGQMIDGWWA